MVKTEPTKLKILHVPACDETKLAHEFIVSLEDLQLDETWTGMVPSHVGHSKIVDHATKAIIEAQQYAFTRQHKVGNAGLKHYVRTIELLRTELAKPQAQFTDDLLTTAALLHLYETVMRSCMPQAFHHVRGMAALLLARPASAEPSEMLRAILYAQWSITFQQPLALGQPSPFEKEHWLACEPVRRSTLPAEVAKLRHISNQLFIRVPRLVVAVRTLRTTPSYQASRLANELAEDLLALRDDEAESQVLHRVNVAKTKHPADSYITPVSFKFNTLADFEGAAFYWQTRVMVCRLCLKVAAIDQNTTIETDKVRSDAARMATNIVMTWQFAYGQGIYGVFCALMAMMSLLGVVIDGIQVRSLPIPKMRQWVVQRIDDLLAPWPERRTEAELEEACDLLVGGPLKGMWVEVFSNG